MTIRAFYRDDSQETSMRCHAHSDFEAVAICHACGRALCPECLLKGVDPSVACSLECQRRNRIDATLRDAAAENMATNARSYRGMVWMFGAISGISLVIPLFELSSAVQLNQLRDWWMLAGACWVLAAVAFASMYFLHGIARRFEAVCQEFAPRNDLTDGPAPSNSPPPD